MKIFRCLSIFVGSSDADKAAGSCKFQQALADTLNDQQKFPRKQKK